MVCLVVQCAHERLAGVHIIVIYYKDLICASEFNLLKIHFKLSCCLCLAARLQDAWTNCETGRSWSGQGLKRTCSDIIALFYFM